MLVTGFMPMLVTHLWVEPGVSSATNATNPNYVFTPPKAPLWPPCMAVPEEKAMDQTLLLSKTLPTALL